ncbi:MAG: hypothetical protein ACYDDF_07880 [Thermoplasmatota archaeon]
MVWIALPRLPTERQILWSYGFSVDQTRTQNMSHGDPPIMIRPIDPVIAGTTRSGHYKIT